MSYIISEPQSDIVNVVDKDTIKSTFFAYQIGAGVKLDASDNFVFDAGYRLINSKLPSISIH